MFFFLGAVAGLLYGLTALGGCLLIVPLLMLVAGLDIQPAITLTLCLLVVLTTITAGDGIRARLPLPGAVWPAAIGAVLAAGPVLWLMTQVGEAAQTWAYRIALIVAGACMLGLPRLMPRTVIWPRAGLADLRPLPALQSLSDNGRDGRSRLFLALSGAVAGVLTGLLGAGGGLASLPAVGRSQADERGRATASSEMLLLPALVVTTTACLFLGRTADWRDTGLTIFGALAGISLARMLSLRMPLLVWQALAAFAAFAAAWLI